MILITLHGGSLLVVYLGVAAARDLRMLVPSAPRTAKLYLVFWLIWSVVSISSGVAVIWSDHVDLLNPLIAMVFTFIGFLLQVGYFAKSKRVKALYPHAFAK